MSWRVFDVMAAMRAADTQNLPSHLRPVLLVLASHADAKGDSYPSQETVGRTLAKSERQIRRDVHDLEELGWIKTSRVRRRGRFASTVYNIPQGLSAPSPEDIHVADGRPSPEAAASGHSDPDQRPHQAPTSGHPDVRLTEEPFKEPLNPGTDGDRGEAETFVTGEDWGSLSEHLRKRRAERKSTPQKLTVSPEADWFERP